MCPHRQPNGRTGGGLGFLVLWICLAVDTPRESVSGDFGDKDALNALDFAYMGSFEARRGKFGLIAGILYFDLSSDEPPRFGGLFESAGVNNQMNTLTALAAYRGHVTNQFSPDFGAGARLFWTNSEVNVAGGALPTETASPSDQWIDPIALRAQYDFSEKGFDTMYLDGGLGMGSEETYQEGAGLGSSLNDRWSLIGGGRYLDFRRENAGNTLDFQQSGSCLAQPVDSEYSTGCVRPQRTVDA